MSSSGNGNTPHSLEVVSGPDLDLDTKEKIRELHARCYPGEQQLGDSLEEVFEQITFLHNADDCTWFLLWLPGDAAGNGSRRLIGMCAGVRYHDSLYVFAFGIDPAFRRKGYGKRVMFGIEVHVLKAGLPCKISATVDARQTRLIAFYERLGAVAEQNSITAEGAPPPPSTRMVKYYDAAEAQSGVAAAEAEILRAAAGRGSHRRAALLLAAIAAAAAALALVLSRRRARPAVSGR